MNTPERPSLKRARMRQPGVAVDELDDLEIDVVDTRARRVLGGARDRETVRQRGRLRHRA